MKKSFAICLRVLKFERPLKLAKDFRAKLEVSRLEKTPRGYRAIMASQRGAISTGWLESIFVGIILLVVLVTFLLQQGLPELLSATSNTTALTDAGATAAQVNWVTFIGSAIFIFFLLGLLIIGIRVATGGSGSTGGSKRRWRRSRK